MKIFFQTLILAFGLFSQSLSQATIIAPPSATQFRNDPYFLLQWGLLNQNQTVIHDLDDIHSVPAVGKTGIDIDWIKSIAAIEGKMSRDVVVAVIDYGVDLEHVDLKDAIQKNNAECLADGKLPPVNTTTDKDGNGYPGDCMGWNFASNSAKGDNRPYDDEGHGTHIAGIMAAKAGNGVGVTGMSSRIKILPVKVTSLNESKIKIPLTARIASGINYAVARNVDVINLSMGYPRSFDSIPVRNAVKNAMDHGIFIVAAAGNNGNPAMVEPCSYEGVICVGAVTNQGELASFSNYGGDVDIVAPGDTILSSIPVLLEPDFFTVTGYDYKDGTSQAAPFVTGTLALLKGAYPKASMSELKARLLSGSVPTALSLAREKQSVGGLVQLSKSFNLSPQVSLYPVWKGIDEIKVDTADGSFEIPVGVENLWNATSGVKIEYEMNDTRAMLATHSEDFGQLKSGELKRTVIHGHISELNGDSNAILKLKISYQEGNSVKTHEFWRELHWIVGYDPARWVKKPITQMKAPIAELRGKFVVSSLTTIDDPLKVGDEPDYKILKVNAKGDTELRIFKTIRNQLNELPTTLVHPKVQQTLSLVKIKSPKNPDLAYLWTLANADQFVEHCFLTGSLKELCVHYDVDAVIAPATARYLDFDLTAGEVLLAPVFVAQAKLPKACTNPDPWLIQNKGTKNRLFYLAPVHGPSGFSYQVNCISDQRLKDALAPIYKLAWNEEALPLAMLDALPDDSVNRTARVLITAGNGTRAKNFILTLDHFKITDIKQVAGEGVPLDLLTPRSFTNFGNEHLMGSFLGLDAEGTSARSTLLQSTGEVVTDYYHREPSDDPFFGIAGVFGDTERLTTAIETKKTLQVFSHDRKSEVVTRFERPLIRFSFLSGSALSESYYPVEFKLAGKKIPAFYIDGTHISNQAINLLQLRAEGIVQPTLFQIEVPPNCLAMNPARSLLLDGMAMTLLCSSEQDAKTWEMRYLPFQASE